MMLMLLSWILTHAVATTTLSAEACADRLEAFVPRPSRGMFAWDLLPRAIGPYDTATVLVRWNQHGPGFVHPSVGFRLPPGAARTSAVVTLADKSGYYGILRGTRQEILDAAAHLGATFGPEHLDFEVLEARGERPAPVGPPLPVVMLNRPDDAAAIVAATKADQVPRVTVVDYAENAMFFVLPAHDLSGVPESVLNELGVNWIERPTFEELGANERQRLARERIVIRTPHAVLVSQPALTVFQVVLNGLHAFHDAPVPSELARVIDQHIPHAQLLIEAPRRRVAADAKAARVPAWIYALGRDPEPKDLIDTATEHMKVGLLGQGKIKFLFQFLYKLAWPRRKPESFDRLKDSWLKSAYYGNSTPARDGLLAEWRKFYDQLPVVEASVDARGPTFEFPLFSRAELDLKTLGISPDQFSEMTKNWNGLFLDEPSGDGKQTVVFDPRNDPVILHVNYGMVREITADRSVAQAFFQAAARHFKLKGARIRFSDSPEYVFTAPAQARARLRWHLDLEAIKGLLARAPSQIAPDGRSYWVEDPRDTRRYQFHVSSEYTVELTSVGL